MITLVTGLWDIGRGNLNEGWNRSYDYYLEKFKDVLSLDCNLIIFGDKHLENFVSKQNRNPQKTKFILRELSWFINNEYYPKIQKIRNTPDWYNKASWLKDSTQSKLELYNPIVMSKIFLLHDAMLLDPFNSEKLYWIDAGLSNTVSMDYLRDNLTLQKISKSFDKFMFITFPYDAHNEVHGFDYEMMCELARTKTKFVSRGGFFGGNKDSIIKINTLYYNLLINTLDRGLMGTEESIFTIMTYLYPSLIDYSEVEFDGLIYRFFESIKNNNLIVKNTGDTSKPIVNPFSNEVGLYVISFNSPSQFESLIQSMLMYDPKFINSTKKFLLDNSTDLTTTPKYRELCNRYRFEHIKKNNIGITGGRQFIAEHFNKQNDLSHYFFFEDDMFFVRKNSEPCKNGFNRYVPNIFDKCLSILRKDNLDFLKLNFTEFYGSHETQWSWYNVPQEFRETHWENNKTLPREGFDPEAPKLEFKNIKSYDGLPYATGEVYLSNWPILMSKNGNYKCYIQNKFDFPYEQTLMSHCYQETIKGNIKSAVLLTTPTEHDRFDFYDANLRKEC
jgi:hypothetical protein